MCKDQKISLHFSRASSPHPSTAKRKKKWKGNFWFCFAVTVSEKSNLILTFLFALFSTLTATEALPYPRLVVALTSANHTQPPTHSPLAFARAGYFGVVCVRSVTSREFSGHSMNMDCARHKQICMCLPRPPCARTNPRRFEEIL